MICIKNYCISIVGGTIIRPDVHCDDDDCVSKLPNWVIFDTPFVILLLRFRVFSTRNTHFRCSLVIAAYLIFLGGRGIYGVACYACIRGIGIVWRTRS